LGFRINSAADNPAGLVISEQMRSRIASLNQEIENTSTMIDKYETADANVQQLRSALTEIRSLAVGAANAGVNNETSREAYQSEADYLVQTYNDTVDNASFGTQKLLDGSEESLTTIPKLSNYDLSSAEGAEKTIKAIDEETARIDRAMADLGATQKNSLETHMTNLQVEAQNLTAAESQIRDTDYIREYANLIKNQLIIQSAMSILSHSSITGRSVVNLLSQE
ncbi:MAG: flagellin, partial [candidate division Zixibacteria bacterium]|nr:flagellin [candidate division Zixibacteria bacterium]